MGLRIQKFGAPQIGTSMVIPRAPGFHPRAVLHARRPPGSPPVMEARDKVQWLAKLSHFFFKGRHMETMMEHEGLTWFNQENWRSNHQE